MHSSGPSSLSLTARSAVRKANTTGNPLACLQAFAMWTPTTAEPKRYLLIMVLRWLQAR